MLKWPSFRVDVMVQRAFSWFRPVGCGTLCLKWHYPLLALVFKKSLPNFFNVTITQCMSVALFKKMFYNRKKQVLYFESDSTDYFFNFIFY